MTAEVGAVGTWASPRGTCVRGRGARDCGRDPGDGHRGRGGHRGRRVRHPRLGWPRVPSCAHRADRRRSRGARGGRRRRRGGALRRRAWLRSGHCCPAATPQGLPAARALVRRSRRRRGARAPARSRALRGRPPEGGSADLRPFRLARGEAGCIVRGLAGERGPDRAARRSLSAQRARPAARWARALLGGHRRGAERLARGPRRRARHALRGERRGPDLSRRFAPGLPVFVPSFPYRIEGGSPAEQLEVLRADRTAHGRILLRGGTAAARPACLRPTGLRRGGEAGAERRRRARRRRGGRYDKSNPRGRSPGWGP